MHIPDVPCLMDSSTIIFSDLDKLDSIIVIYLSYPVWARAMLVFLASFD